MTARSSTETLGYWLSALYFFSGAASLGYEVLWARMISVQFGVSIFGAVITVAAFMVGLGFGSVIGTRACARVAVPLRAFAWLELSVGLFALLMPWAVNGINAPLAHVTQDAGLTTWYGVQLGADFILMLLPAIAMGAGFPLLLVAARDAQASLGRLYGVNALGGVLGALLPLVILPALGWAATAQLFALSSIVIAAVAFHLCARAVRDRAFVAMKSIPAPPLITLLLYGGVGAAALMLEIAWTRVFGMIMLRTEYVLALIIGVFLLGIGIGSIIAKHLKRAVWLQVLPLVAAGVSIFTLWLLAPMSQWIEASQFSSLYEALLVQGSALALLTLPVTISLGAWLPLLTTRTGGAAQHGALLYGANSLGAAIGTLVAGFVFVPFIGSAATVAAAAAILLACGLLLARARFAWLAIIPLLASALPVLALPSVAQLLPRALGDTHDMFEYEDALSLTHVVARRDGQRVLLDDLQRMDAASDPDAVVVQQNQARLPLMLHAHPRSVLFLGMGTGISASGAVAYPDITVTAVELSRGAVLAARGYFAAVNGDIVKHIDVVRDDARRFLARDVNHYDVIIGDLFHPDLAGRSALLSVEQFARAKARLSERGVFVQWIALNQFDAASLEIVLRSFVQAFPEGSVFIDPFRLALVGMNGAAPDARDTLANLARLSAAERAEATGGEGAWTWLGRYIGTANTLIAHDGAVQHEATPRIEFILPKARYRGGLDLAALLQHLLKQRAPVQLAAENLHVPGESRPQFDQAYRATELALAGWIANLRDKSMEGERLLQLAYEANAQDRWIGVALVTPIWAKLEELAQRGGRARDLFGKDEQDVVEAILRMRPDHVPALKALMKLEEAAGNAPHAADLRARIRRMSPLDNDPALR